ncbi:DUF72 domain-containing protein [Gorillibacterium timonense]|uniref:DUF72 domain-containing protein n=1 Tax=Gorillibacterium timonense TaxID=1689269 RepID=UPI00071E4002|nr:DUF72 domain-containing protein [Gorillibacterium timonense]
MIRIGLAGWGDHDSFHVKRVAPKDRLREYAAHFPVVEVDSSFYAVQPEKNFAKWVSDTPDGFGFMVKAYQGMTGHLRGKPSYTSDADMYTAFVESLTPAIREDRLVCVLFQYPPWFACTRENVAQLREARERMGEIPCALEFRHQSWFTEDMLPRTLDFMRKEGWVHTVCDEPQVPPGSVPAVLAATSEELTLVRLHGRNAAGWVKSTDANWREVRYLYRYSTDELADWMERLELLKTMSRQVCVIFNNNSGGDAADNALELMGMLPGAGGGPAPRQLDLF